MSKNRLDESTIRRFMGLSGLAPLGENFIDRIREEEEELAPEPMPGEGEEAALDAAPEGEMEMGDEEAAAPADPADAASEMATDVADAVADALTQALGKHGVEVSSGEAGTEAPMDDAPMDDAPMDDAPMDDAPMDDAPMDDEEAALEEAGIELIDNDAMVQEIARRVAARLVRENRKSRK
jgi:hypothetical protein